jgi:hypothetical protein
MRSYDALYKTFFNIDFDKEDMVLCKKVNVF